jgi:hypothetical protein
MRFMATEFGKVLARQDLLWGGNSGRRIERQSSAPFIPVRH